MSDLHELVAEELSLPVDPRVGAMAQAIADQHGVASRAVLFYGSCLREKQLEGLMLDFYLIVGHYRSAYAKRWHAAANRLIPPNVFYFEHDGLSAKYAVLSEADFRRLNGPETSSVSVWARFAQPSRLVWAADDAAGRSAIDAVARAAPTLFAAAQPRPGEQPLDCVLAPPICQIIPHSAQGTGYTLRLGSATYPNLKMKVVDCDRQGVPGAREQAAPC